jgi:predicted DNA-binding transcriptional regulator AlpA
MTNHITQHEPLLTIEAVEATIGMAFVFVAPLINRGMFPQPVHMSPPLWRAKAVRAWHRKVLGSA